ncbi:MAG: replication initiator protein A [Nitrosospira sp.]
MVTKTDKLISTATMIYALELVEIEEQLAALERTDQRLQAMAEQSSNNPDLKRRRNEIIDKAAPLERRRQEIIAAKEAAAEVCIMQESELPADIQPELDFLANVQSEAKKNEEDREEKRERSKLLPARYTNQDFFVADILGYSLKDDHATMEAPVFSLKTQKDLTPWEWTSKDSTKHIEVSPSVKYGRATQHDKDILIFVISQMTEALNRERLDTKSQAVRFTVHNYLVATNKPTGGIEYQRLERALDRLKGTTIKTDIKTGNKRVKEAFGILDSWTIIERSPNDERMIAVEVTLSKWLYNAIQAHEVLTIHPDYFRLRKPLERRLYELARKHCGNKQASWKIGLELLREKCGAQSHMRAFRNQVQEISDAHTLPEYHLIYNREIDQVTFYIKNQQKLISRHASGETKLTSKH